MKPNTQLAVVTPPNRRAFLKGLGAVGAASLFSTRSALADQARYADRFQLFAEGTVMDFSLAWPLPPVLPVFPPGTILRVRIQFPLQRRDILEFQSFVASENAPEQPLLTLTLFHMRIDQIGLSATPAPNFGLFGRIFDNPVVDNDDHSPFGDLTGLVVIPFGFSDMRAEN